MSHLGPWMLLPLKPGVCQECGVDHPPEHPHNQQSLYYQYHFYDQNGRWPTWADAMAHCSEKVKAICCDTLKKHGINVEGTRS